MDERLFLPEMLTPPERLAIRHAPDSVAPLLAWLLRFDRRLGEVVLKGKEATLVQLRLAWWRDSLAKNAGQRPKGEPLLRALSELETDFASLPEAASQLLDAWEESLGEGADQGAVRRGAVLFGNVGALLGADPGLSYRLGAIWAGIDNGPLPRCSPNMRCLSLLALSAQIERKQGEAGFVRRMLLPFRLLWHSLTGS